MILSSPGVAQTNITPSIESLPQETLDFAHRMFDAARDNNAELLLQAIDAGLPPNLTNHKGNAVSNALRSLPRFSASLTDRIVQVIPCSC